MSKLLWPNPWQSLGSMDPFCILADGLLNYASVFYLIGESDKPVLIA